MPKKQPPKNKQNSPYFPETKQTLPFSFPTNKKQTKKQKHPLSGGGGGGAGSNPFVPPTQTYPQDRSKIVFKAVKMGWGYLGTL